MKRRRIVKKEFKELEKIGLEFSILKCACNKSVHRILIILDPPAIIACNNGQQIVLLLLGSVIDDTDENRGDRHIEGWINSSFTFPRVFIFLCGKD